MLYQCIGQPPQPLHTDRTVNTVDHSQLFMIRDLSEPVRNETSGKSMYAVAVTVR